jgi:hypothetical protein
VEASTAHNPVGFQGLLAAVALPLVVSSDNTVIHLTCLLHVWNVPEGKTTCDRELLWSEAVRNGGSCGLMTAIAPRATCVVANGRIDQHIEEKQNYRSLIKSEGSSGHGKKRYKNCIIIIIGVIAPTGLLLLFK